MTLKILWSYTDQKVENAKIDRAYEDLRVQAEVEILKAKNLLADAKENYEKQKMSSKDTRKFDQILEANIQVKNAEKRYEFALEVYKDCFGEKPKMS